MRYGGPVRDLFTTEMGELWGAGFWWRILLAVNCYSVVSVAGSEDSAVCSDV